MRISYFAAMIVALACLSLCGCNRLMPELLLPGLTLPPGATVVYHGSRDFNGRAMRGVGFNDAAGWDAVKAHFDQVLGTMGYHAQSNLQDPSGRTSAAAIANFPSATYTKEHGAYLITLEDTVKMSAMEHMPPPDVAKFGQFMLTILSTAHGAAGK